MKILLLGKNGQIGWELQRAMAPLGEIIALGRQELDLSDQQAIRRSIRTVKPDIIVNAAAYNAVDKAEQEQELAMALNGIAPGILAEEAALLKAAIVHYSTDYIFDGTKTTPHTEDDAPNPINTYGKTKLAGEEAIVNTGCRHLILRTSWVYGLRGQNFLLTILRLAAERDELSIVNDQHGAPTWSRMIAEATSHIISADRKLEKSHGLYHLTAAGQTTWFSFSEAILIQASVSKRQKAPTLKPITTAAYPTPAARPLYSVLDNSLINEQYGITLPDWQQQLELLLLDRSTLKELV